MAEKRSGARTWLLIIVVVFFPILLGFLIDLDDLIDAFRSIKLTSLIFGGLC